MNDGLPWGHQPYDLKTPTEIVDDYVLVRGDLSEEYARRQLALVIERHIAEAERRGRREALIEVADEIERDLICCDAFERRDSRHRICYWAGASRRIVLDRVDGHADLLANEGKGGESA